MVGVAKKKGKKVRGKRVRNKSIAFVNQKVTFRSSKAYLLPFKRCPFENQYGQYWSIEVPYFVYENFRCA